MVASFCNAMYAQIWASCQLKKWADMGTMQEKRLSTKEAAAIIGYSHLTLKKWRRGRKEWELGLRGPKFKSVHGRVFYTVDALETWLKLCGGD